MNLPADPKVAAIHTWLEAHADEILATTREMLRIDTVESPAETNAPYGAGNRRALDYALKLSSEAGFRTTDLEGHLGYGDFGQGERLVFAVGHLDVVPVGSSWTKEPFGAQVEDGYLYSRGATDDKGPTMAAFWAMRAIKETFPEVPARMRMGFGCDEESGFGCVERYVQTEEAPTFGITPDSGWPCYNAEKGICDLSITIEAPEGPVRLGAMDGGSRPNIVIDHCYAMVGVDPEERSRVEGVIARYFDRNLTFSWEAHVLQIEAFGQAAHGSRPFTGDSAAVRIFRFLVAISPPETLEFYEALLDTAHPGGEGLGIHGMDPVTGLLSCNLGIADAEDGELSLLFNIRYNVDTNGESLRDRAAAKLSPLGASVEIVRDSPPLYFPADSPLVRTIVDVYEAETGERKEPGAMGGGTYARAVPNTISIGTSWIGDGDAHGPDERIKVDHLLKIAKIYGHILYQLATIPATLEGDAA